MKLKAWSDVRKKWRELIEQVAPRFSKLKSSLATMLSTMLAPLRRAALKHIATATQNLRAKLPHTSPQQLLTRSKSALQACLQTSKNHLQAYWQILRKNPARNVAGALVGASVGLGLFSVFVAGVEHEKSRHDRAMQAQSQRASSPAKPATKLATKLAALDSSPKSSLESTLDSPRASTESNPAKTATKPTAKAAESSSTTPPRALATSGTRQALQNTPPAMPAPDESESVITGSLTYGNAIAIARQSLLERDFTRARIWIYRAYTITPNVQEVWSLYWQSWDEDAHASIEQKQEAYALSLYARSYYRF